MLSIAKHHREFIGKFYKVSETVKAALWQVPKRNCSRSIFDAACLANRPVALPVIIQIINLANQPTDINPSVALLSESLNSVFATELFSG